MNNKSNSIDFLHELVPAQQYNVGFVILYPNIFIGKFIKSIRYASVVRKSSQFRVTDRKLKARRILPLGALGNDFGQSVGGEQHMESVYNKRRFNE